MLGLDSLSYRKRLLLKIKMNIKFITAIAAYLALSVLSAPVDERAVCHGYDRALACYDWTCR